MIGSKPDSNEKSIQLIRSSLEKRGHQVRFISKESNSNATFDPDTGIVTAHKGDLKDIAEEAFHTMQWKKAQELGFNKGEDRHIVLLMCEIEICQRWIENSMRRNKERVRKFLESLNSSEAKEVVQSGLPPEIVEDSELMHDKQRLQMYKMGLQNSLLRLSKADFGRFRILANHTYFKSAKELFDTYALLHGF